MDPAEGFDEAAQSARRKITSGRFLSFQVEPEGALIRVWKRGEARQRVMGQASTYDTEEKRGRALELPEAGEYLITLVAQGFPDYVLHTLVEGGRGPAPKRVRVAMTVAARQSGMQRVQVSRAISFRGRPEGAQVFVDGARKGPAKKWPGGMRPGSSRNLQLDPGLHKIRIMAPGYEPFEIEVEVRRQARKRVETIEFSLQRKGS